MVVLFDLDGTLTDPKVGITRAVAYALEKYGISAEPDTLTPFIGPPLAASFARFYGFSEAESYRAVEVYREYFSTVGIFENTVYAGIPALLHRLRERGDTVALATSKPTVFAKRILTHFGLDPFFDAVVGSELDGRRTDKGEVIAAVLDSLGIDPARSAQKLWMVGDREYDLRGAHKNAIAACGVLYGYGSREELLGEAPEAICATVADLTAFLLQ